MTIFDLLFLVLFLASVVTFLVAAVCAIRRGAKALSILRRWGFCFAVYMAIVLVVAVAKPQRFLSLGEVTCFDDWCYAVSSADHAASAGGLIYNVTIQLSSRARGIRQRANGAAVYLTDRLGRRFDPSPDASATPLDVYLDPGQMVEAKRSFSLPNDARDVGLVMVHGGANCIPGCFIIGDTSIVGKRTIVRLP